MGFFLTGGGLLVLLHLLIQLVLILRILLRPHRQPASRIAWIVVVLALPVIGILAYILFGEINIGRYRVARTREVLAGMPAIPAAVAGDEQHMRADIPTCYQHLFAGDWMSTVDENIDALLTQPIPAPQAGLAAQVVGTGPTVRYSAMPEMFECLMHAAREELVITTPYYVPDESMLNALCTTAWRGVTTRIIFPASNDSWIVGAASRSYYAELLAAGVEIYEYVGGLLHAKSLTLDGEISLIGSANMDRRSFDLNYENNILLYDPKLTTELRQRQQHYLDSSRRVEAEQVAAWPVTTRLRNTTIAMLGPLL